MKTIFNFLKQIWTSSIRRQLMLGIILVHAVLMSIFVYDLVERQREFLHTQSVNQAKSLAKTLAVNSASWVLANDVVGLEEILSAQNNYPGLRYAMVLSPDGKVLGHTEIEKVGLFINDDISGKLLTGKKERQTLLNNKFSVDIASPIFSNGMFIGWARVNLTQQENAKSLQIITRDGVLYTALAIFIGAFFAFFMAKGITSGLKHIVDIAEGIKFGDQTLRVTVSRHDELGKLGEDFNLMLDTIDKNKRDLQAILDHSPAIIYTKDLEGRFTFINREFLKLYSLNSTDVIGKTLHDLFSKDIADEIRRNDLDVIESGQALESEEVAPHPDGVLHTYVSNKFPLRDEENRIYAICGISTDITDNINIKNEKSFLEKQLLHTQKIQAIGQLTGGIAHDFNNILAVILGYSELIKDKFTEKSETLGNYIDQVLLAGTRGQNLVEQMMIYSRKDQSNNETAPMNIELTVIDTTNMLKATIPTSINIETAFEDNIPYVKSNAGLISQILLNLCMNAKDSMGGAGNLLITLGVEKFTNNICTSCREVCKDEYVVIGIKDDGKGISNDILERIFEPFYTSKKIGEGTGMGLSVVHGIVHKLGGHIVVESEPGEGAIFKILLPISNKQTGNKNTKKLINAQYDFSDLKIMIVDDEPAVATLLEESLKQVNANTVVFTNSVEALAHFSEQPDDYDFVITDQSMPSLTGVALSKKMLALDPEVKIILCTGFSTEVTEESALQLGIKSFLNKPIEIEKFYNIINELK